MIPKLQWYGKREGALTLAHRSPNLCTISALNIAAEQVSCGAPFLAPTKPTQLSVSNRQDLFQDPNLCQVFQKGEKYEQKKKKNPNPNPTHKYLCSAPCEPSRQKRDIGVAKYSGKQLMWEQDQEKYAILSHPSGIPAGSPAGGTCPWAVRAAAMYLSGCQWRCSGVSAGAATLFVRWMSGGRRSKTKGREGFRSSEPFSCPWRTALMTSPLHNSCSVDLDKVSTAFSFVGFGGYFDSTIGRHKSAKQSFQHLCCRGEGHSCSLWHHVEDCKGAKSTSAPLPLVLLLIFGISLKLFMELPGDFAFQEQP